MTFDLSIDGSLLLIGGGGDNPRIYDFRPALASAPPRFVADFTDRGPRLSVYALALSSHQRFIAAGTLPVRDAGGNIVSLGVLRAWRSDRHGEALVGPPCLELFQPAGVCALDITDDGLVLAACGDGVIRAYSCGGDGSASREFPVCSGFVLSVRWMDVGKSFAAYGQDGCLRIFDFQTGAVLAVSPACPLHPHAAVATIAWSGEHRTVWWGCGVGHLHAMQPDGSHRMSEAHPGGLLAVAWHALADCLVTGGAQDGRLRQWKQHDLSPRGESGHGSPVLGIVPLADNDCAVMDAQGGISLYRLGSAPAFVKRLGQLPARSWVGPDLSLIADERSIRDAQGMDAAFQRGMTSVRSGDYHGAEDAVRQLTSQGYGQQALLLQSALLRAKGDLLHECQIWLDFRRDNGGNFPEQANGYRFAELLELLEEPELAADEFAALGAFLDAPRRASELKNSPLWGRCSSQLVYCDLDDPAQVMEELEKCSLLGRAVGEGFLMQSGKPCTLHGQVELASFADELAGGYDRRLGELCINVANQTLIRWGKAEEMQLLSVTRNDLTPPLACMELLVELRAVTGGQQYQGHVVFSPGRFSADGMDPLAWNKMVAGWWHEVWTSTEMKDWADKAFDHISQHLERARIRRGEIHKSRF